MTGMYLEHYGVLGMKWGVRRYQNADGSLTEAGKKQKNKEYKKDVKELSSLNKKAKKLYSKSDDIYKKRREARAGFNQYAVGERMDPKASLAYLRYKKLTKSELYPNRLEKQGDKYIEEGIKKYESILQKYGDTPVSSLKNDDRYVVRLFKVIKDRKDAVQRELDAYNKIIDKARAESKALGETEQQMYKRLEKLEDEIGHLLPEGGTHASNFKHGRYYVPRTW